MATLVRTAFSAKTLISYAMGYALAAIVIFLGFAIPSVAWLAFGLWLSASLTVLLIDKAAGEKLPRPGTSEDFGAVFSGSPVSLIIIGALTVAAFFVAVLAQR
jgi:hypothetical protein